MINVRELFLKTECLVGPFNGQHAVLRSVFSCPKKQCVMQMPPWVHLKPVTQTIVNADVEVTEK